MNKTKRKILDTALILLNEQGVSQVSQRSISESLKISPGNLTYHYKKKAEIIEAIYFELVEKMNEAFKKFEEVPNDFNSLIKSSEELFDLLYQYRFFFIDIVQIFRTYQTIANHYRQLQEIRKEQFKGMISQLFDQKIIRPEELPNEYEQLYNRIQINFDFYLSYIGTNKLKIEGKYLQEQKLSFIYALYPYLTEAGKKSFTSTIL
jgi:AcrR family transcriptional regulator